MIDKEKFLNFIAVLEGAGAEHVSFDDLRKFVEEADADGWISCSERLPECEWGAETEALLYQHKGTGSIEVGYYGKGGKFRDSYFRHYRNSTDGVDSKDVIAWQPLPEPYKEVVCGKLR